MKKIKILVIGVIVLCSGIFVVMGGKRPFKKLGAEDILSATVTLNPPDKTIEITEIKELTVFLNDIVLYQRDDSYNEYSGQWVEYNVTLIDGRTIEIAAYNPFIVIDGKGYKCKYEPCQRLNALANRLLSQSEEKWDLIPMVMIDGVLYLDTGKQGKEIAKCGVMDGEITSSVTGSEIPSKDDQSNFGTGYGYQIGSVEGTVEILINGKWWVFATEEYRDMNQSDE